MAGSRHGPCGQLGRKLVSFLFLFTRPNAGGKEALAGLDKPCKHDLARLGGYSGESSELCGNIRIGKEECVVILSFK